mmetsp:Transcript_2838/g.6778  ORF Transcript_2838/g.6778 Transcript_2838/m.6778 type:complete len:145 (-) Transcript_2838:542-976(-)
MVRSTHGEKGNTGSSGTETRAHTRRPRNCPSSWKTMTESCGSGDSSAARMRGKCHSDPYGHRKVDQLRDVGVWSSWVGGEEVGVASTPDFVTHYVDKRRFVHLSFGDEHCAAVMSADAESEYIRDLFLNTLSHPPPMILMSFGC